MTNPKHKAGTIDDWTPEQARKIGEATELSVKQSGGMAGQIAADDESLNGAADLEARGAEFPRAKLKEQRLRSGAHGPGSVPATASLPAATHEAGKTRPGHSPERKR